MLEEFKTYLLVNSFGITYYNNIRKFLTFCENEDIDIACISYNDMTNYMLLLKENNYSTNYINGLLKAIRCFYKFLLCNGKTTEETVDVIKKFKLQRVDRKIKDRLTEKELEQLISSGVSFVRNVRASKIKAILYFMFFTGVRRGELINLKRVDINLEEMKAIIRTPTKNRRERMVFFPKKVKKRLQRYFDREEEKINAFNMTEKRLNYFVKQLNNFVPIGRHITVHTFRHSFANMLATKGIDVRIAQKLLGHASIQSTLIYYDPDINVVEQIYRDKVEKV